MMNVVSCYSHLVGVPSTQLMSGTKSAQAQELTRWRERVDDVPPRCLRGGERGGGCSAEGFGDMSVLG
jgi:hypothetical protein